MRSSTAGRTAGKVWRLPASMVLAVLISGPLPAPLNLPVLDDRSYEALRAEAQSRIPVHNPAWTDHNPSDPGVTLLDFFRLIDDPGLTGLGQDLLKTASTLKLDESLSEDELLRVLLAAILDGALLLQPNAPSEWSDFSRLEDGEVAVTLTRLRDALDLGVSFRRGDANADGALDIADGIRILNHLFLGRASLPCRDAADSNDSGELDITDAVFVLVYQFLGGPPPPAPFQPCGDDPTPDELGCAAYPACP